MLAYARDRKNRGSKFAQAKEPLPQSRRLSDGPKPSLLGAPALSGANRPPLSVRTNGIFLTFCAQRRNFYSHPSTSFATTGKCRSGGINERQAISSQTILERERRARG